VGHGQGDAHEAEDRAAQPLGGPQRQVEDGPEGQQALDDRVAVEVLGPPADRAGVGPGVNGPAVDPDGQRAPVDQGPVVLTPVADSVEGLLGCLAHPRNLSGIGPESEPFVQQRQGKILDYIEL